MSRKLTMYSEKRHEPEELKAKLLEVFQNGLCPDIVLREKVFWELGDVKTMLLIFDRWYWRIKNHASIAVLLTDYRGYQGADILPIHTTPGMDNWGVEEHLKGIITEALKTLGFTAKNL